MLCLQVAAGRGVRRGLDSFVRDGEAIILQPWWGAAPASLVLQVVALFRLRGLLRSLSVILAVMTGAVAGLVFAAYLWDPGNLWQLLLILATPPVFVLTTGVLLMGLHGLDARHIAGGAAHRTPAVDLSTVRRLDDCDRPPDRDPALPVRHAWGNLD